MSDIKVDMVRNAGGHVHKVEREPMALEVYPPESDLTKREQDVWIDALHDMPLKLFKRRNVHLLREYCKARIAFEDSDLELFTKEHRSAFNFIVRLESLLGLSIAAEFNRQRFMSNVAAKAAAQAIKREALRAKTNSDKPADPAAPIPMSRAGMSFVNGRAA